MHVVFLYGTLQHAPLLDRLLGRVPPSRPAELPGWRAVRLRDRVYPGLVPEAGARTVGRLVEIDHAELDVLDRFEGPQYERVPVSVHAGSDRIEAGVWRLRAEQLDLVLDEDWELDGFLAQGAGWFVAGARAGDEHPRESR